MSSFGMNLCRRDVNRRLILAVKSANSPHAVKIDLGKMAL